MTVVYQVQHTIAFGPLVVLYFFLAGLSAGLFLLSSLGTVFGWERMQPLAKPLSALALATIIPGGLSLLLDLGQPFRALYLFTAFNPLSVMSWGSYILMAYCFITTLYVWLVWRSDARQKVWGAAGIAASLALGLYTGILIAVSPGHPLWNSAVIPVLFLVSGIIAALSLVSVLRAISPAAIYVGEEADDVFHSLKGILVSLELVLIAAHLIILGLLGSAGAEVVKHLLIGARQFSFVGLQITMGTLVPLAILFFAHRSQAALGIAGFLSLAGVAALRYNIVVAGQELPDGGTLLHTMGDGGAVWMYAAALLILSGVLAYIIPGFMEKCCQDDQRTTRTGASV